jgi:acyl-CoA synthetase (AMP-forming)/AMP-acid ligase II
MMRSPFLHEWLFVPVEVSREWSAEVLPGIVARSGARQAFVRGRDVRDWGKVAAATPIDHLPPFQVPTRFVRVDALPHDESGKLLRAALARGAGQAT